VLTEAPIGCTRIASLTQAPPRNRSAPGADADAVGSCSEIWTSRCSRARAVSTARPPGSTSSELARPDPWLSGGELAAVERHAARHGRRPSGVRHSGSRTRSCRGWASLRASALRVAGSTAQAAGRAEFRGCRGSYDVPCIRNHRGGVHSLGQRAVRGAASRDRGARTALADRAAEPGPSMRGGGRSRRVSGGFRARFDGRVEPPASSIARSAGPSSLRR